MIDYFLYDFDDDLLGLLVIVGRSYRRSLRRVMEPVDMLIEVNESEVFEVDDIKDAMGSGGSAFINREEHVLLLSDDFIEEGVVVAEVLLLVVTIGCFEKLKNFNLAGNFYHLYNFRCPV